MRFLEGAPGVIAVGTGLAVMAYQPATAADPGTAELLRRIEERDAAIARLEARVELLERRAGALPEPAPTPTPTTSAAAAAADTAVAAPAPTPGDEAPGDPRGDATRQPAPGQVEVDPEAAERALERTLVLSGDLLLPPGQVDVEPFFRYAHDDSSDALRIVFVGGNDAVTDVVRVRADEFSAGAGVRVGLPYGFQAEASLPFDVTRRQVTQTLLTNREDNTAAGIGDLRLGLAKTLVRERGWVPDVVGRVYWDSNTGRDEVGNVPLDSGFNEFGVSFSALKRQDPLAFVGRFSFEHSLSNDGIQPGNLFGAGFSAVLAASPETSISTGIDIAYRDELNVNGRAVQGSDQNQATISFGVSTVLGRGTFLNVRFGAGLTEDSTDYFVTLAVPFRFTAW
ncbi:MAG: transporter [Pseudomonadota bacterium]